MMILERKMDSNKFTEPGGGVVNFQVLHGRHRCWPGLLQTWIDGQQSIGKAFMKWPCCLLAMSQPKM